jgi:hypothetical protein
LSEPTATAAAKKAGVSLATLMRWLNESAFSTAYREARGRMIEDTMRVLQAAGVDAVQCLRGVIASEDAPITAKVSASRSIIEFGLKGREVIDVEARLKALEDRLLSRETKTAMFGDH